MDKQQGDKILEKLGQIEIKQAVTHEKLTTVTDRLNKGDKEYNELEKRVDKHDVVVGGVVIAMTILGALVKFKIL